MSDLYVPPDVDEQHDIWGANCGPCSLAALLGRPVASVRELFPGFERRHYVNPTHMKEALRLVGARFTPIGMARPDRGLACIQICGSWMRAPVAAQYRHTHWIAVWSCAVYDVNAGHWVSRADWEDPREGVIAWIAENTRGATGEWFVRSGIAVPA